MGAQMVPSGALSAPEPTPTNDSRGRRARLAAGLLPAAALLLVALWEIVTVARAGGDVGDERDWQRAAEAVRAEHQRGDLIVFAPDWIDPIGRLHLGDLIEIETAARMDAARYGTIWEVAVRGARAPEARGEPVASRRRFGAVTVRRIERAPVEVLTDFVEDFAGARVAGAVVGRPAVALEEVGFEPHRCVRVVPRPDGTATVTYEGVRLGTSLVGYVGLADVFTRRDVRDPGRLAVRVDGRVVAEVEAGVEDGWVRFEAATEPGDGATVEFAATAVGPAARDRRVCFAAEARR
jgi:hypothetical protein